MENNSALRNALLAGLAALTVAGCAAEPPEPRFKHAYSTAAILAVQFDPAVATAAINTYRAGKGLRPVRLDPALTAMAQRQAKAMAASDALSHDVAGSFSSRLAESGIDTTEAARISAAVT